MPNPAIPREDVHRLAEACADAGDSFEPVAMRLMRDQRRLSSFLKRNAAALGAHDSQVALYMTSVCLRILDQIGGRMKKVANSELDTAAARISGEVDRLLPFDDTLPERVREIQWRAQPHLLDEILWALYEKDEDGPEEGEGDALEKIPPERSGVLFLGMWAVVEAMDIAWTPPAGFEGAGPYTGPVPVDQPEE